MPYKASNGGPKTFTKAVTLYPQQDKIIRTYADEFNRSYSNALQFIVEDWARLRRAAIQQAEPEAA